MNIGEAPDWDEVVDQLGPRLYTYFNRRNLAQLAFGIAHYVGLEALKGYKSADELSDQLVSNSRRSSKSKTLQLFLVSSQPTPIEVEGFLDFDRSVI